MSELSDCLGSLARIRNSCKQVWSTFSVVHGVFFFFPSPCSKQTEDERAYHQDGDDEAAPLPPATAAPLADPLQALADAEHADVAATAITPAAAAVIEDEESPEAAVADGASLSSSTSSAGPEGSTAGSWVVLPAVASKKEPEAETEVALLPAPDASDAALGQ